MKRVVLAVSTSLCLLSGLAWARNIITTPAGCHSEFGSGGASKSCTACVKGGGKYVQHAAKKGVWACEK